MDKIRQIAENIKTLRKKKNWSQSELAEKIGVHLTHINRIENGKYNPSIEDIIKLSEIFEVSIEEIFNTTGDKKNTIDVLQNTPLYQKIKLIEKLNEKDKNTILNVIDSILAKNKFKDFFQKNAAIL